MKKIAYFFLLLPVIMYSQETKTTEYEYDNLNRLVKVIYIGETEKNYPYDDLGNRVSININALSIDSETLKNTITIYPNPTNSTLNIKLPNTIIGKNVAYKLYDVNGRLVKEKVIELKKDSFNVDVGNLANGVYLLNLNNGQEQFSQLFIKK